jgi:glycosyltransferase involved in cell wall biosynthesis
MELRFTNCVYPDNLIAQKNLGFFSRDRLELISGIQTLLKTTQIWQRMSENARQYYEDNHALDQAMQRFENIFLKTLGENR